MARESGTSSRSTLLCASLSAREEIRLSGDPGETIKALEDGKKLLERTLTGFGLEPLESHNDDLLVEFNTPANAAACSLRLQRVVDDFNGDLPPENRIILGIGIHCEVVPEEEERDEGWLEETGLRVASALSAMAKSTDAIFISAPVHALIEGKLGLRFRDFGEKAVPGEDELVDTYQVFPGASASDWLVGITQMLSGPKSGAAPLLLVIAAIAVGFAATRLQVHDFDFATMRPPPKIESIAVMPFSGDGIRTGGESYRDTIPAQLIDALARYEGLRVASRSASFAREATDDPKVAGAELGVDGVVTGFASTSGDWLLTRAAIIRVSDGSEVWSGAYYRRASEADSILSDIARSMAAALELQDDPATAGQTAAGGMASAPNDLEFAKMTVDLEDALKQVQTLAIEDEEKVTSLNNLASLYYDTGRDAEAIPLYLEVIAINERELGPDHPEVAVSLNNLASLYMSRGEYAKAEPLYQRSLKIRRVTLGQRHPRVGNALSNLATLYHRQGKLEEAEILYQQALRIRERELDLEPSAATTALNDKAAGAQLVGQYDDAQKYYRQALDNESDDSGTEHPRTASATRNLAVVRDLQGDSIESESLFQLAISIFTKSYGPNHPEVGRTKASLAEHHRREGRYAEALTYHEDSLEAFENSLGENHPEVAGSLGYIVAIFEVQGREEEAQAARARQKRIRESYLGPIFSYAAARANNNRVLRDRKKDSLSEPQPLHEYMVTVEGEGHATEKRRFAENLHNMAMLYVDQRRYAQAEEYDLRALEIRESVFGRLHPEVALSLHSLGRVYTFRKRYPEADQRFKEALRIFEVTLGELHPYVARCWEGLAEMSRLANRTGDSEYAAVRAREIRTALAAASPPQ